MGAVSEELSSVETGLSEKIKNIQDEFQKNLVVWKPLSENPLIKISKSFRRT